MRSFLTAVLICCAGCRIDLDVRETRFRCERDADCLAGCSCLPAQGVPFKVCSCGDAGMPDPGKDHPTPPDAEPLQEFPIDEDIPDQVANDDFPGDESPGCAPDPSCDDGNPCTEDLMCPDGCAYKAAEGVCDDGNPCTFSDRCIEGKCGGTAVDCDDGNPCTKDSCTAGECGHAPVAIDCDDANACTKGDSCAEGKCVPGQPVDCDDQIPCTADSCDPLAGCVHDFVGIACDDGDPCTTGDACVEGVCTGAGELDCLDGNPCTTDICVEGKGCIHVPQAFSCDDGNACTVDDLCDEGQCVGGPAADCDDGNPCTTDACDAIMGCTHDFNGLPCDDGDACTTGDKCDAGVCEAGQAADCDDQNPCTSDSCDKAAGCQHVAVEDGVACNDGNSCTQGDQCSAGKCAGEGIQCDDGNPCTDDGCDNPAVGCVHVPNVKVCDDKNLCTANDQCADSACKGQPVNCDDKNACTTDLCVPSLGCVVTPNQDPCDDGNMCTIGDKCSAGKCNPGPAIDCNDGNICTADACNPATGCVHANNQSSCDDGNPCTSGDKCAGGVCTPGAAVNCDDANPCTNDFCDPAKGCVHTNNQLSCDDGNKCTTGDKCSSGKCVGGLSPICNDGNPCTDDSCKPATGCTYVPNTKSCDDKDACTAADTCANGACKGGPQVDCNDGDLCTADSCDPLAGCVHASICAKSCLEHKVKGGSIPSGVYTLDPDWAGPVKPFPAWCEMEADGGGWTLVLKTDGNKSTFGYDSILWVSDSTLDPGSTDMSTTEAKLDGYVSIPFAEMRLGMRVGTVTNWLVVPMPAGSMQALMQGPYKSTSIGRNAWKSLIPDSSLQLECNKEGINLMEGCLGSGSSHVRIGIVANNEADCCSPDSRLGFGGAGSGCGEQPDNTCGNETATDAGCGAPLDNGERHIKAFGYIMVR